ncbi:MAG: YihY/virulence factor BrkB family protein [Sphingobacteriaceae bacterium]|nr:YihY/virulence factor BrkB family protein [Sphingobacteriaceae bacterium]
MNLNPILAFKKAKDFITHQIWSVRLDKLDSRQAFIIKQLRVITLAFKGFKENNCITSATALTFYTLFSIVPVLALVFAIAKGFGVDHSLQVMILKKYSTYEEVLSNAFLYANKMLSETKGGVIAGFGIVLLLWSVLKLLVNIEEIFNQVWEIKRGRSWIRKMTDYLTIMLVGPVLFMLSGGLTVAVQTKMGNFFDLGIVSVFLVKLLAYTLVAGVFTFIYMALPNTKVKFKSAFAAAVLATVLFELLGWGYVKFQIGASRLSAIYGGFAALPLFLIWIQYTWYIVLFGAQLAFANQNAEKYELAEDINNLSTRYRRLIALLISNLVAKRFYEGKKALTINEIAHELDLPNKLARNMVNEFVACNIFVEVRADEEEEIVYQPGVTESKFNVKYLFEMLDKNGVNTIPIDESESMVKMNGFMLKMETLMDSEIGQTKIKDLIV